MHDVCFVAEEFPQLGDKIYLDHAGATLYTRTQIEAVREELLVQLVGNPHSSPDNVEVVEEARNLVLQHFNTDNQQYDVIFTSGATAGIKEWSGSTRIDIGLLAWLLLSIVGREVVVILILSSKYFYIDQIL